MSNGDIMQKMGALSDADGADAHASDAPASLVPAEAATTSDSRSNDEKHASLLKGAGVPRVRTREELTHRTSATPKSDEADKARRRSIAIGLVLAVVVVAAVLATLVLLGANSTL